MAKTIRAAGHYQDRDAPVRRIADAGVAAIKRDVKQALMHLGTLVPDSALQFARAGDWHGLRREIAWGHFREILKAPFARIGKVREAGAQLGARKINGLFAQAGRKIIFRKYNPDQPRDQQGRWTSEGASTTFNVGGKQIAVTMDRASMASGERLVMVNTEALDRAWARDKNFYVGRGGEGETASPGRYSRFQDYLANHDAMEASSVGVQSHGQVGFTNGRHRFAVLRDMGIRSIPVSMDRQSIRNAQAHGLIDRVIKILDLAKDIGDRFTFDLYDQKTQDRIRKSQDQLIQQLEDGARDSVAEIILAGAQQGLVPDAIVEDIRSLIGLTDRQARAVMNYQRMLYDLDPDALARRLRNADYDEQVQDAIDSGEDLTDAAISAMTADYAENYLDYRAGTIADTESTRAASAGLQDAYAQAIDRGALPADAVTQFWQIALDEKTCLPAGVRVMTPWGVRPIESLRQGDAVETRKGQRKLVGTLASRTTKTMVLLSGDEFFLPLTCDHILPCNGEWIEARQVKPGDLLHGPSDQRINVRAIAHVELADADCAPSLGHEARISIGIFEGVAVPEDTVDLYRDLVFDDRKIDEKALNSVFLFKRNPSRGKGNTDGALWQCFAIEASVAAERAELSISIARLATKIDAAISARDLDRRTAAFLGTVSSSALVVLDEDLSASLAWDSGGDGQSARFGADVVSVSIGDRDRELVATSRADLRYMVAEDGVVTSSGAIDLLAGGDCVELISAGRARGHSSTSAAWLKSVLARVLRLGHRLDLDFVDEMCALGSVSVYDIQVDEEHEFFANGALVHNCEICLSIPDMNPDGVGIDEPFESIDGQMDAPPDPHPACRCSLEIVTDLDKVPEE